MIMSAARSLRDSATVERERVAAESMTSIPPTSTITPRDLNRPTWSRRFSCNSSTSESLRADWIDAIRYSPCLRMGTATLCRLAFGWGRGLRGFPDLVAEKPLCRLDSPLEILNCVHHAQIHTQGDQRLRDLRRQSRHEHLRPHEPASSNRLNDVVGHRLVDGGNSRHIDDHYPCAVGP